MSRYPQQCDEQGRIESDVQTGSALHYSEVEALVDLAHSRNPADQWRRETVREFIGLPIPSAKEGVLRQTSSRMETADGRLWCSGCQSYHPKTDFSKVKLPKHIETAISYSRAALIKRGYRYWCKDYEAYRRSLRYYGRLGDKAQRIAG